MSRAPSLKLQATAAALGRARLLTNRSTGPAVVTTDMVTGSGTMRALNPA